MFMHENLNQELKPILIYKTINPLRYISIATNKHRDHFCVFTTKSKLYQFQSLFESLYKKKYVISQMIFLSCFTRMKELSRYDAKLTCLYYVCKMTRQLYIILTAL